MSVAGRRRLVAQPGGLTLGFALHLVFLVAGSKIFLILVQSVVVTYRKDWMPRSRYHTFAASCQIIRSSTKGTNVDQSRKLSNLIKFAVSGCPQVTRCGSTNQNEVWHGTAHCMCSLSCESYPWSAKGYG